MIIKRKAFLVAYDIWVSFDAVFFETKSSIVDFKVGEKMQARTFSLSTALMIAVAFAPNAAFAFNIGDWVLTRYQGGPYYYPGVVAGVRGNTITTQYDDGDVDVRLSGDVKPYDWHPGTRVECNWLGQGTWYPGKIAGMQGDTNLSINYDDGDQENTTTALCRSQ